MPSRRAGGLRRARRSASGGTWPGRRAARRPRRRLRARSCPTSTRVLLSEALRPPRLGTSISTPSRHALTGSRPSTTTIHARPVADREEVGVRVLHSSDISPWRGAKPAPMKLGLMNHPGRPVADELRAIAGAGFEFVGLTLEPPAAWPIDGGQRVRVRRRALSARAPGGDRGTRGGEDRPRSAGWRGRRPLPELCAREAAPLRRGGHLLRTRANVRT